MNINYVQITKENLADFSSVLPQNFETAVSRISIGAYNDEGYVLGAVSLELIMVEYVIDWIYVHPEVRRQGIGAWLIQQILKAVIGIGELFPVVARYEVTEDDMQMHSFFLSCQDMTTSYSHERYYVTAKDIRGSDTLHRPVSSDLTTSLFFELQEEQQKKIITMLFSEQNYDVGDYDRWKKLCVPELCRCVFVKNSLVDLIFIQRLSEDQLELSFLYGKYPRGLFELLSLTVKDMEMLLPDCDLSFDAMSKESDNLAKHLFPRAKSVHIYEAQFL